MPITEALSSSGSVIDWKMNDAERLRNIPVTNTLKIDMMIVWY